MLKKIVATLLSLVLIFNCGAAMAATQTSVIKEDKTAKVIIDGTLLKTVGVPIIKDKKMMLSTEVFTALGVSTKNQVWDRTKTKLTLIKGRTKVVMQLNSLGATLNGVKKTLSSKPVMYKKKAYFPLDFIAACFDKQLKVDTETNTYFLKNKADFTKNKALLDSITKAMNAVEKLKVNENVTLNLNGNGVTLNKVVKVETLTDKKALTAVADVSSKMTTNGEVTEDNTQGVLANNMQYLKVNNGDWAKQQYDDQAFAAQFDFSGEFTYNDIICSALNTATGTTKDETILKGNIIMGPSISQYLTGEELVNNKLTTKSIEITLDKNTNIVSKVLLKVSGTTIIEGLKYNVALTYEIKYSDINGGFSVLTGTETFSLIVGFIVAFIVALAVVSKFIAYLQKKPMKAFAVYRIIFAIIVLVAGFAGLF